MKNLKGLLKLMLTVFLLYGYVVNGQKPFMLNSQQPGIFDTLTNRGQNPLQQSGIKRGVTAKRILGNSSRKGVSGNKFEPVDSAVYLYSGNRGLKTTNFETYYDGIYNGYDFDEGLSWVFKNQAYVPSYHVLKTWDAQDRPISKLLQQWKASSWVNVDRVQWTYNGNEGIAVYQNWDASSQSFANYMKDSIIYQSMGLDGVRHHFGWNSTTKKWSYSDRYTYSYDSRNNVTEMVSEFWDSKKNNWRNSRRYYYQYNDSNITIFSSNQFWDTLSKTWLLDYQVKSMYDANNHYIGRVTKSKDKLYDDSLIFTSLNASGNVLTAINYKWVNGWVPSIRFTRTYSKPELVTSSLEETWTGNAWVNKTRLFLFYNGWELVSDSYSEDWKNSAWVASTTYGGNRYYYEEFVLSSSAIKKHDLDFNLFPVPANESMTLSVKWPSAQHIKIIIYNAEGKICNQWQDDATGIYVKDFSVANLESGIYHICIKGEKDSWNSTFTVQH